MHIPGPTQSPTGTLSGLPSGDEDPDGGWQEFDPRTLRANQIPEKFGESSRKSRSNRSPSLTPSEFNEETFPGLDALMDSSDGADAADDEDELNELNEINEIDDEQGDEREVAQGLGQDFSDYNSEGPHVEEDDLKDSMHLQVAEDLERLNDHASLHDGLVPEGDGDEAGDEADDEQDVPEPGEPVDQDSPLLQLNDPHSLTQLDVPLLDANLNSSAPPPLVINPSQSDIAAAPHITQEPATQDADQLKPPSSLPVYTNIALASSPSIEPTRPPAPCDPIADDRTSPASTDPVPVPDPISLNSPTPRSAKLSDLASSVRGLSLDTRPRSLFAIAASAVLPGPDDSDTTDDNANQFASERMATRIEDGLGCPAAIAPMPFESPPGSRVRQQRKRGTFNQRIPPSSPRSSLSSPVPGVDLADEDVTMPDITLPTLRRSSRTASAASGSGTPTEMHSDSSTGKRSHEGRRDDDGVFASSVPVHFADLSFFSDPPPAKRIRPASVKERAAKDKGKEPSKAKKVLVAAPSEFQM